jgi:hypothetical protein
MVLHRCGMVENVYSMVLQRCGMVENVYSMVLQACMYGNEVCAMDGECYVAIERMYPLIIIHAVSIAGMYGASVCLIFCSAIFICVFTVFTKMPFLIAISSYFMFSKRLRKNISRNSFGRRSTEQRSVDSSSSLIMSEMGVCDSMAIRRRNYFLSPFLTSSMISHSSAVIIKMVCGRVAWMRKPKFQPSVMEGWNFLWGNACGRMD